jgi:hypothetical protein
VQKDLPSKCKALSATPRTAKKKKKRKERKKRKGREEKTRKEKCAIYIQVLFDHKKEQSHTS